MASAACCLRLAPLFFLLPSTDAIRQSKIAPALEGNISAPTRTSSTGSFGTVTTRGREHPNMYGVFSGLTIDRSSSEASFWGRDGKVISVQHGVDDELSFAAEYSDGTGVSDLVYYRVHPDHFCVGCGRGSGWHNDEQLEAKLHGLSAKYYATRADYNGVGHFRIDRGHQAPVGSFNQDDVEADLTNMPTNLSPQTAKLNQGSWVQIEMDVRVKAAKYHKDEGEPLADLEIITGPVYQLPHAMLHSPSSQAAWDTLLIDGEETYDEKKKKWKDTIVPLCAKKGASPEEFTDAENKTASMTCYVKGEPTTEDPRQDPNSLSIEFNAGKRTSTGLRVPLAYFKLFTIPSGSRFGRRTCAFVMDQVGQCLITSVEHLSKIARIDLTGTVFAEEAVTLDGDSPNNATYTSYVNPYWCSPPGSVLRRRESCISATQMFDPSELTEELFEKYWKRMRRAETGDKKLTIDMED